MRHQGVNSGRNSGKEVRVVGERVRDHEWPKSSIVRFAISCMTD